MLFKDYVDMEERVQLSENASLLLELAMFADSGILYEGAKSDKLLKTFGLSVHKSDKGILKILAKSSKTMKDVFVLAIKAARGDEEAKVKLKSLLGTKITRSDIVDFILRLDQMTLHLITGPIHVIDSLTGWHIWTDYEENSKGLKSAVKKAIAELERIASNFSSKIKAELLKYIKGIKELVVVS